MSIAAACTPSDPQTDSGSTDPGTTDGGTEPSDVDLGIGCPPSQGPTMVTDDVSEDETWTADRSPYIVGNSIAVRAELTLEPCVDVQLGADVQITIRDAGSIVGIGTAELPIHIGPIDPEAPFAAIRLYNGGPLQLAHATVEGGGAAANPLTTASAMIDAQGVDAPSPEAIDFDHVSLLDSRSQGILLRDGAEFSQASTDLVVSGSDGYPVVMWASGLSTLPSGEYTDNGRDAIFLIGSGPAAVTRDATMHDRGVPYVIGGEGASPELRVGGAGAEGNPLLTIEAGVELRFPEDGVLHVDFGASPGAAVGALAVEGTAAAPVVFTSNVDAPAAGAWLGIYYWNIPDPRSRIDYARVEFAGGVSQLGSNSCTNDAMVNHDAAIRLVGGQAVPSGPAGRLVSNTTIVASAGDGIDRGWIGEPIDFLETNTFEDVARCFESYPRPEPPAVCPEELPCPM